MTHSETCALRAGLLVRDHERRSEKQLQPSPLRLGQAGIAAIDDMLDGSNGSGPRRRHGREEGLESLDLGELHGVIFRRVVKPPIAFLGPAVPFQVESL